MGQFFYFRTISNIKKGLQSYVNSILQTFTT